MKYVLAALIFLLVLCSMSESKAEVLGFKAWKTSSIEGARQSLERLQLTALDRQTTGTAAAELAAGSKASPLAHKKGSALASLSYTERSQVDKGGVADKAGAAEKEAVISTAQKSKGARNSKSSQEVQMEQAQLNLEIAEDLGVNDYFILYLNRLNSPAALLEAAKKLSPEEVAELLLSYQKQLKSSSAEPQMPALHNNAPTGRPAQQGGARSASL